MWSGAGGECGGRGIVERRECRGVRGNESRRGEE